MRTLLLARNDDASCDAPSSSHELISAPEQEMQHFVRALVCLVGQNATPYLMELWLDELACLECMPEYDASLWRKVSVAAATRLASEIMASQLGVTCF